METELAPADLRQTERAFMYHEAENALCRVGLLRATGRVSQHAATGYRVAIAVVALGWAHPSTRAQTAYIPAEPLEQQYQIQGGQHPRYRPLRYDDDFSFLSDPSKAQDYSAPLKYIRLIARRDNYYLTIGGQTRQKFEQFTNYPFTPPMSATMPAAMMPALAPPNDKGGFFLERYHLHLDLHLGYAARFFGELKSNVQNNYEGGPQPPQVDSFDYNQAFADVRVRLRAKDSITLRGGRQELLYGGGRLVTVREGPNARLSFDGGKILLQSGDLKADAFLLRPVQIDRYSWDNRVVPGQTFWGIYATAPLNKGKTAPNAGENAKSGAEGASGGEEATATGDNVASLNATAAAAAPATNRSSLDTYYFGLHNRNAITGQESVSEKRHTAGTRLFGQNGKLDYRLEAAYQWGRFGSGNISAYSLSEDVGYFVFSGRPKVRLGLRSDFQTGDRDPQNARLQTFNPLFGRADLYDEASFFSSANLVTSRVSMDVYPGKGVTATLVATRFWRQSAGDGLYSPGSGRQLAPATPGNRSLSIGTQATAQVFWQVGRHETITLNYSHLFPDRYLRANKGRNANYFTATASYIF